MQNLTLSCQGSPGRFSWQAILPFLVLLAGLSSFQSAWAQTALFYDESVSFNQQPTGSTSTSVSYAGAVYPGDAPYTTYVQLGNISTSPAVPNPNLGTYDINNPRTSQLVFTGASIVGDVSTGKNNTVIGTINQARVLYRVYLNGTVILPNYTALTLLNTGVFATGGQLYNINTSVDILGNLLSGGTYTFDVQYQLDVKNSSTGKITTYTDPSASYQANFTVTAPAVTPNGGTTTWISNSSTAAGVDWLNAANWNNGVPTRFANAIIPDKTIDTSTPLLSDPNATYEVRTLTLQGLANSSRALLRIGQSTTGGSPIGANLRVYGDLNAFAGGILASVSGTNGSPNPLTNSTLVLARNDGGAQAVRGSKLSIVDIRIEGRGLKAIVATELAAPNTFSFVPDTNGPGAIARTAGDNATRDANGIPNDNSPDSAFPINTTQSASVNLKSSGFLQGETNSSFIQGILIADRSLESGKVQIFGNIGIDITPDRNIPAPNVVITRTVGDPLRGPTTTNGPAGPSAPGSPQPIKRQYGISGDVNNNTTSTIVFHYLNSTDELNGIPESQLTIFKTANNSPPFFLVGRTDTVDLVNHTVTRVAYSGSLNTLTLGDQLNPLPVQLIAFNATRSGVTTLVTWSTATEQANKGFEVQVSTDGTAFRTLGFVSSETPNSLQVKSYKYVDTENGKFGTRYYRLHQIDLDGKASYSPVRAVNFDGSAGQAGLAAYPNPFTDKLDFNLDATVVGNGVAYMQLLDMMGRVVREQSLAVQNASLTMESLGDLRAGLYMARITLPDGSAQTVRIQKQ